MEFSTMMELLLSGFVFTLQIFVTTLLGALPLGILVALGRMSRFKPIALITRFYISVMRGTPLMLQLMALMFGPYYLFGLQMGNDWKYVACSIGFIINYAAYFGEIYRSGIQSIPRGQYEAASVLGYSRLRQWATRSSRWLKTRRSRSFWASWKCSARRRRWRRRRSA